jgi:hypothetical protein
MPAPKRTTQTATLLQGTQEAAEPAQTSTAVATLGGRAVALPSGLMARLGAQAKDQAAQERPSVTKVSLRGGMLGIGGNPVAKNILPAVIMFAGHRNAYYDGPFDPNNLQNPVCFALGANDDEMFAHENVPDGNVGPNSDEKDRGNPRSCSGCKYNDWGSDPKGGRGKACKETRRLVLIPGNGLDSVEAIQKAEMAILDIPVTSGKNYSNFVNALAAQTNLPPWAVVTDISTERDAKTQFKVTFTPMDIVSEDEDIFNALEKRKDEAQRLAMTPYDEVGSTNSGKMADGAGVAAKTAPKKSKF